jgi:hypothetical protein
MTIQIGPLGPDPTPTSERPLDVRCYSRPVFRIIRQPTTGWANLPETFRGMTEGDILEVRSRNGKDQPQVGIAAKKARIKIRVESKPMMDAILVTYLGPAEEKAKAPAATKLPKTPKSRCFKNWKRDELFS